jgi:flagellar hook-associated protein 3 FlgL
MRIAGNMLYDGLARGLNDSLNDLNDISLQLATGKKINKPSDDVLGTLRAIDYKLSISQNSQSEQNIAMAANYFNFNDTVLTHISTTLQSLKQLTIQNSGTTVDQDYYASQAAELRDTLQALSNSTYLNSYIFAGSKSDQQAYTFDANTNLYLYQGDGQQISVSVGSGLTSPLNILGNSTTSAVVSAFGYTLPAATTTTLSDGNTATFTPVVDLTHNSTSIQVQITDPNQNVVDNFSFSNVMDMANLISHAWKNKDVDGATALTTQQSANRIETLSGALDNSRTQVLSVQGQLGLRQTQLNDQKSRLDANTLIQQNSLSQTEDAEMDQTIVSLQKMSTVLNALRSAAAKILPQTLFDFLR